MLLNFGSELLPNDVMLYPELELLCKSVASIILRRHSFFFFSVGKLMGARSRKSCFSQSLSLTSGSVGVFTSALAKLFLLRYEELYVHLFQH